MHVQCRHKLHLENSSSSLDKEGMCSGFIFDPRLAQIQHQKLPSLVSNVKQIRLTFIWTDSILQESIFGRIARQPISKWFSNQTSQRSSRLESTYFSSETFINRTTARATAVRDSNLCCRVANDSDSEHYEVEALCFLQRSLLFSLHYHPCETKIAITQHVGFFISKWNVTQWCTSDVGIKVVAQHCKAWRQATTKTNRWVRDFLLMYKWHCGGHKELFSVAHNQIRNASWRLRPRDRWTSGLSRVPESNAE